MISAIRKTGLYASVLGLCTFMVFTLSFVVILFVNPLFTWTGMADFARYTADNPQVFKYMGMLSMLIYGAAFVVIAFCERTSMPEEYRLYGDIAAAFALAFCICISVNYFIQLTATRLQMLQGYAQGLEQFTQSFPISVLSSINMLGWTIFYGLSTLFLYIAYRAQNSFARLRLFYLLNSVLMLISAIGFALQLNIMLAITMNLGLGMAGFGILICLLQKYRS